MNHAPSHTFSDEHFKLQQKTEIYTLLMTFTTLLAVLIAVMVSAVMMVSISVYRGVTADILFLSLLFLADILLGLALRSFFSHKIRALESSPDMLFA